MEAQGLDADAALLAATPQQQIVASSTVHGSGSAYLLGAKGCRSWAACLRSFAPTLCLKGLLLG